MEEQDRDGVRPGIMEAPDLLLGGSPCWEAEAELPLGEKPLSFYCNKEGAPSSLLPRPLMTGLGYNEYYVLIKQAYDRPHFTDPFHPHPFPNQKGPSSGLRPRAWW